MKALSIYVLVQEFYALEAITAILTLEKHNKFEPMKHSHSRWYRDFNAFRDEYIYRFANAIFDYTVLVVAGELRHCASKASHYIYGYYDGECARNDVYNDCAVYNPRDILTAGIRMFDTNYVKWGRAFGGDKWYQIAMAGLLKDEVPDCIFVDHCVDLSHNNSVYFDKGAGIFYLDSRNLYREFLDFKRSCEPQTLIKEEQGHQFNSLLKRAFTLNIIEEQPIDDQIFPIQTEMETRLLAYQPIAWGDKRLALNENNIMAQTDFSCTPSRRKHDREYANCA